MAAQDMLHKYYILVSLKLDLELPKILKMDNFGDVDIAISCGVDGRTCHVDGQNYFLQELKEQGLLLVKHTPCMFNYSNILQRT